MAAGRLAGLPVRFLAWAALGSIPCPATAGLVVPGPSAIQKIQNVSDSLGPFYTEPILSEHAELFELPAL